MKIEKEIIQKVMTTDGEEIKELDTVAFDINEEKCMVGIYKGITPRGSLRFQSVVSAKEFHVMPRSIVRIKKVVVLDGGTEVEEG